MPIMVNCPSCKRTLRVRDELLGTEVKCPSCGTTFPAQGQSGTSELIQPVPPVEERSPSGRRSSPPPEARRDYDEPDSYEDEPPRRSRRRSANLSDLQPHRGSTIATIGILSFFFVPIVLGPIAWMMGNHDLQEMAAGRMDPDGEGQTRQGRICGMITTIISGVILGTCGLCVLFSMIAGAVNQAGH